MNVLIISPYFAPCTLVGALRMTSLTKYLVAQGSHVTVIKLADGRTGTSDCICGTLVNGVGIQEFDVDIGDWKKTKRTLQKAIDEVCTREHFDCCVASFGPFSSEPATITVQTKYRIPLIVDYRDLWLFHPMPRKTWKLKLVKWYNIARYSSVERRLVQHCTWFVSVTPRSVQSMIDHYPILAGKSSLIYNGYTDVEGIAQEAPSNKTDIYIVGKLSYYSLAGTKAFFEAVMRLQTQGYPIRVTHIGQREPQVPELLRSIRFPEEDFRAEGQHPYADTIRKARNADLFVAINRDPDGLETKVFDYIYMNKPIVAYGPPDSEFGELIGHAENAFMCQTGEQMEAAIQRIIDEKLTYLTKDDAFRASLSRASQNERYYQLLRKLSHL